MQNYTDREIKGTPSNERSKFFKQRYLSSPLMMDIEYIQHLTHSHQETEGMDYLQRRAVNHAFALSNITPVIHENDILLGNKTRYIRGAIPYLNYAADPFIKEIKNEEQDAQSKFAKQGHGGGIEKSLAMAAEKDLVVVS